MNVNDFSRGARSSAEGGQSLSHAYIVWGDGRLDDFADRLASAILCAGSGDRPCGVCTHCVKCAHGTHPDLIVTDRIEGKREISVDQIRAIRQDAFIVPNEAAKKVYVIKNAGLMNTSAQNALLKVLEEPPSSAAFILVARTEEELLDTVRSRCVPLHFLSEDEAQDPAVTALAGAFLDAVEAGGTALCAFSFKLDGLGGHEISAFLDAALAEAVTRLKSSEAGRNGRLSAKYMRVIRVLDEAKKYASLYISSVHIAGLLCAELLD